MIRFKGGRIENQVRAIEWRSLILLMTSYKGQFDIRSFYEIAQSLVMGRSWEYHISETVRVGRFVSTESPYKVDGPLSNAAVGSDL
jgi:hypothetical protein